MLVKARVSGGSGILCTEPYHNSNVVPDFGFIPMGDSNIPYQLRDRGRGERSGGEPTPTKCDQTYLGSEGVDDMTRERFCKLEKQKNRELCPGKGCMFFSLKEWGLFVNRRLPLLGCLTRWHEVFIRKREATEHSLQDIRVATVTPLYRHTTSIARGVPVQAKIRRL